MSGPALCKAAIGEKTKGGVEYVVFQHGLGKGWVSNRSMYQVLCWPPWGGRRTAVFRGDCLWDCGSVVEGWPPFVKRRTVAMMSHV